MARAPQFNRKLRFPRIRGEERYMTRTIRLWNSLRSLGTLLMLFAGIQELSATTLVVGNCKSTGQYITVEQALYAAPQT
jgi:hypothetical protein